MTKGEAEKALLQVVADKKATEKTVAAYYAAAILSSDFIDFPKANEAIRKRWGKEAVEQIKEMAWEKAEQQKPKEAK